MDNSLKIGVQARMPEVHPCVLTLDKLERTRVCPNLGYSAEILGNILASMRINYTLIPASLKNPTKFLKAVDNNNNNNHHRKGLFTEFFGTEVDTVALPFYYTETRSEKYDFADPVMYGSVGFIKHHEKVEINSNIFAVFDSEVWIALAWSILAVITFYSIGQFVIAHAHKRCTSKSIRHRIGDHIWTVITVITDQYSGPEDQISEAISSRMILGSFGLLVVFFFSLYQSSLLSSLMAVKGKQSFEATEDLAPLVEVKEYELINDGDVPYYYQTVRNSHRSHFRAMKMALEKNPERNVSKEKMEQILRNNPKAVAVMWESESYSYLMRDCQLEFRRDRDLDAKMASYMFPKGHPILESFNEEAKRQEQFTDQVFREFRRKETWKITKTCSQDLKKNIPKPGAPLSYDNISTILWVFGIGIGISVLGFILEVFAVPWAKKYIGSKNLLSNVSVVPVKAGFLIPDLSERGFSKPDFPRDDGNRESNAYDRIMLDSPPILPIPRVW